MLSADGNAANIIPEDFSLPEAYSGIIFVYGPVITNPFFSLWVQMYKRAGIVKGLQVPLLLGFQ